VQKVCFHGTCSEIFRVPSVDAFQINRNRSCGSKCTNYVIWRKGKSTLPRDCNFPGQSHPALDRCWCLVGEVSALGSDAVRIQSLLVEISARKIQIRQKLKLKQNDPVLEQLSTDCTQLRKEVSTVKVEIAVLSPILISSEICSDFVQFF
jgi:hypothetical protein